MRNPHPRQNQEPAVVDHFTDVPSFFCNIPADETVAAGNFEGGTPKTGAGDDAPVQEHQILQLFAGTLMIAEIMEAPYQPVEKHFISRAPYLPDVDFRL